MIRFTQANGETLDLPAIPQKIVSVVPSITENLFLFGVTPVGRTRFCIEPKPYVEAVPSVGGPKSLKLSKIVSLKPDLVIANQEENLKEEIEAIQEKGIPVWLTYPKTVEETIQMLEEMKGLVEQPEKVDSWISCCKVEWEKVKAQEVWKKPKVLTLIWKKPWIGVGGNSYIHDLITLCGGENILGTEMSRYPEVGEDKIMEISPDIILFPTEPYPFKVEDRNFWKTKFMEAGKSVRVEEVCGEDICWPGPRMIQALRMLTRIISSEA